MASNATFALNSGENFLFPFIQQNYTFFGLTCCPKFGGHYNQYYLHNTGQSITLIDNSVFHCTPGVDLKTVQAWDFINNIQNLYSTNVAIIDDGVDNHEDLVKSGGSKFPLLIMAVLEYAIPMDSVVRE